MHRPQHPQPRAGRADRHAGCRPAALALPVAQLALAGLVVVAALVALVAPTAVPALAQVTDEDEDGEAVEEAEGEPGVQFEGIVVHGVTGEPVEGARVRAHPDVDVEVPGVGAGRPIAASDRTDDDGRFAIGGLAVGEEFDLAVEHDGATYPSQVVTAHEGQPRNVELVVHDSTTQPDDVAIASWVLWLDQLEDVVVQQDLQVVNRGQETWVGHEVPQIDERSVVRVPLQAGAAGRDTMGRFSQCCATIIEGDYVHTTALPPGETTGTLRYSLETLGSLSLPADLPVESLVINAPEEVDVEGEGFEAVGQVQSQGRTYISHQRTDVPADTVVEVDLDGLGLSGTPTWQLAAAGGAAALAGLVLVLGLAAWRGVGPLAAWRGAGPFARRREAAPEDPARAETATAAAGADGASVADPAPADHPTLLTWVAALDELAAQGWGDPELLAATRERRAQQLRGHRGSPADRETLLDELAAVEEARARGLLDEAAYQTLRTGLAALLPSEAVSSGARAETTPPRGAEG